MSTQARSMIVTGSSGLIGSEVVEYFCSRGWEVHGVDNNMRADFFGPQGDTRWNQQRLMQLQSSFRHHELDIRNRPAVIGLVAEIQPRLVVHAAAQPSHDLAAQRPFDDFDVNAVGTLNMLEATQPTCAGRRVRAHEHEQGLWRRPKLDRLEGAGDALGLRRPDLCRRHQRGSSRSIRPSTACSALQRSPPT